MSGRDAPQLRAVAPLVTLDAPRRLVGPVGVVSNGRKMIGVTSAELLRPLQGAAVAIATRLDGSATVPVSSWVLGRYSGLALLDLGEPIVEGHDVAALEIGAVCASNDTRGAPAALATIVSAGSGFARAIVDVHVDADDGGGMSDVVKRLASPIEAAQAAVPVEGGLLFAWFPPDPALGRPSEVLAVAVAIAYRANLVRPRGVPVIAELVGLDDLGRALLTEPVHDARSELPQVAGEIEGKPAPDPGAESKPAPEATGDPVAGRGD